MPITLNGTTGIVGPDGSASTPAIQGSDANTGMFFPAADTIAFAEGGAEVARFDSSGNFGIGTSSPTARLHVSAPDGTAPLTLNTAGGSDSTRALNFNVAGDNYGKILVPSGSGGAMAFWTGGANAAAERMRIDSAGNVGIGTSSPAVALDFGASKGVNSVAGKPTLAIYNDGTNAYGIAAGALGLHISANASGSDGQIRFFAGTTNASPTERARIDSSGRLLVGKTSAGDFVTGVEMQPAGAVLAYRNSGVAGIFGRTDNGETVRFTNNGNTVGTISTTGSATAYNTSSDYRLKHDIAPMTGALAKVAALKPVTYKWNADESDGEGFIAHELAEVVPQCVTGEKDAVDENGNPQYQGIDTSFLVATLTAAIQEQQALIQVQSESIAALTARVQALEGQP